MSRAAQQSPLELKPGGRPREQWGTRLGVILAVAGSAVGLGNFLRFPGQAAGNGGGAFMIPYFCALIFLGIPLCWAEWAMGRRGGRNGYNSYPAIFGLLGRHQGWSYAGALALLIPVVIYMYYVLIESWCLAYAYMYFTGQVNLGSDPTQYVATSAKFFESTVGSGADGVMLDGRLHTSVVFWIITFIVNFIIIYRGVTKGIERFCMVAMPLMAICAFIVLVRVLTLPAVHDGSTTRTIVDGLGFMWNPKADPGHAWWTALANPQVWLASAGQIFFTLSVGFGIIVNYASYLRPQDDVALSGLTAASTNEFFEVCLGGLITIPAAFLFLGATGIESSLSSSFTLGFNTLPVVFTHMPAGNIFGGIWFFMLFLAAITSSLSMLQPAIAFLEEGLNIGRHVSVTLLGILTALGSLFVIWFSKNLVALDTMDFWVGSFALFILALLEVLLFSWVFGARRGYEEAMAGAAIRIPRIFVFIIKYVSPVYLLVVLVFWTRQNAPGYLKKFLDQDDRVPLLTLGVMVTTAALLIVAIYAANRRWRFGARETALTRGAKEHA